MEKRFSKEDCIALLQNRYAALLASGEERYPKRSDFEEREVVAIKAHLGPWPRALEASGIKPPREDDRKELNKEKRLRAKRRRIAAKKEVQVGKSTPTTNNITVLNGQKPEE